MSWTYTQQVRLVFLFILLARLLSRCDRPIFSSAFSVTYRRCLPQLVLDDVPIRHRTATKLHATTTSEFVQYNDDQFSRIMNTTKRLYSKDSAVSRIKQAALHASAVAAREQQKDNIQLKNSFFSNYSPLTSKIEQMKNTKSTVTLRQLTSEIDSQLHRARALPWEQYHHQQRFQNFHHQASALPRDSMAAIVTHNYQNDVSNNGWRVGTSTVVYEPNVNMTTTTTQHISAAMSFATIRHVAVVLTKRSIAVNGEHLLTVECAKRIQRLIHAINYEKYKPDVIVFVGEKHVSSTTINGDCEHMSDADMGYDYFMTSIHQSVDPSLHIDLTNVTFHMERMAMISNALANIATYIQSNHIVQWFTETIDEANAAVQDTAQSKNISLKQNQQYRRRPKLHVHFALISSDYYLCILNDIHVRSPGQSPLRYVDRWTTSSIIKNITSSDTGNEHNVQLSSYTGVQLETSWTYMYSTTASLHHRTEQLLIDDKGQNIEYLDGYDDGTFAIASFSSVCYQRAQDLIPVLHNLRGVVANTEFFQRENYRVLVQARRSLVSGMELLYQQQPSLAAIHKVLTPLKMSHTMSPAPNGVVDEKSNGKPLDVVLEGALLSLGRCLDLVRPAGLLTGSVSVHDFKLALMVLDQAVTQISFACDPDQPIYNDKQNKMKHSTSHSPLI